MQTLAKMNPLSYAKSMAARKDARKEESMAQLKAEVDMLTSKMESQEEEFKRTSEFLKQEITDLLVDNQKLRDYVEETDNGPEFLKSLSNQSASKSTPSHVTSSPSRSKAIQDNECDIGRSSSFGQASQFTLIAEREKLNNQLLDVQHELKRVTAERDSKCQQFNSISAEYMSLKVKSDELMILSADRKKTIDEMKAHIDESKIQHESVIASLKQDHETEVTNLNQRIESLSKLEQELRDKSEEFEQVVKEKDSLSTKLAQVEQELAQVKQENSMQKEYYESRISDLTSEHEGAVLLLNETHATQVQSLEDRLSLAQDEIKQLTQSAADEMEDRKIHEKKAVKMMKELKRNLDQEKSRAAKLQQKLQDFLSQTTSLNPDMGMESDANLSHHLNHSDSPHHHRHPHHNASGASSSGHLLTTTTTASSSSTSTPLKFPAAAASAAGPGTGANSVPAVPADDYDGMSRSSGCSGSQHQSDERLNDTSSVGSWSFMSNSRNGGSRGNGNGIDKIGTNRSRDYGIHTTNTNTTAASSSDHSNGSNDFAPTSSISSSITTTAIPAAAAADASGAAARQQLHHLAQDPVMTTSPSSSSSRNNAGQTREPDCGPPVGSNGNVLILIEELECENRQLVDRISEMKQENWQLEERVNQLLAQVDSLSADVRNKGLIIEYYCMGGDNNSSRDRSSSSTSITSATSASNHNREKMTARKVFDFIKDRGDENLKEINRKLQRLLEETLTKNMFLQQDLENLSHEVVRLSKESVTLHPTSGNSGTNAAASSKSS
jgi:hypothetical protein